MSRLPLMGILFGNFWTKAASMLSLPFLAIFLSRNTSLSPAIIGIIIGCQPLAAFVAGFVGGYFSDHIGKQRIIFLSLIASVIIYFGFYFTAITHFNLYYKAFLFSVLNLANGLFASFFSPVSQAIIGDLSTSENKTKFLHLRYMAANAGAAIGPIVGAYAGISSGAKAFLITAILYLLYTFVMWRVMSKELVTKNSFQERIPFFASVKILTKDKLFSRFLLSAILFSAAYSQITSTFSLVIEHSFLNGVVFFSWMCSLNATIVVLLQPLSYMLTRKKDPYQVIFWGNTVFIAGCLMTFLFPFSKILFAIFIVLITIGEVLVVPTQSVLTDLLAPKEQRGLYFGATTFRQVGSSVGPMLGGFALEKFGQSSIFLLMIIFNFGSALLNRQRRREEIKVEEIS